MSFLRRLSTGRAIALLALSASLLLPIPAVAEQVAVLLPQKGRLLKVAQAVRDGLLAAYYQDSQAQSDSVELRFYDSSDADITALMRQVQAAGANAVIGPIEREQVQALVANGAPGIPVIALNRADGGQSNLLQLALAPEDEILTLVQWMRTLGVREPLVVVASTDEPGLRQQRLFQQAWTAAGGSKPESLLMETTGKGGVVAAMRNALARSGSRDAVFLASPGLAMQVLPAMTYYNSKLKLYSLSAAWEPAADSSHITDLDGLRFCGLPWLLDVPRPEQLALYAAQPRPDSSHDRLHALGADAWSVLRERQQLLRGDSLDLRTGRLQINDDGQLIRTPTCAEVRHGTATPVSSPSTTP